MELALLLPLLVMLAFGIIEFSTAYNRSQGMQAGVREGARLAATGDVADAAIEARLINALQSNNNGSGFPEPGGTGDVGDDIDLTVAYFADETDFGNGTTSNVSNGCEGAFAVRVTANITPSRQDDYGLVLPLIPGSPYELSRSWEAIFRCLG